MRAIAGLWTCGKGSITRLGGNAVFFMPQRPYMCLGTLYDQLVYPRSDVTLEETDIRHALEEVLLDYLIARHGLHVEHDWSNVLSLGEQQRINFARLILFPTARLALIDEGTSACDRDGAKKLYKVLQKKVSCFISVGHQTDLRRFHTR